MRAHDIEVAMARGTMTTMPGGRLVVALVPCPTCGAQRGQWCTAYTWPQNEPSQAVHIGRRSAAITAFRAVHT